MGVQTGSTWQIRLNDCGQRLRVDLASTRGGNAACSRITFGNVVYRRMQSERNVRRVLYMLPSADEIALDKSVRSGEDVTRRLQ